MEILTLVIGIVAGGLITFLVAYYFFKKSPSKKRLKK